MSTATAPFDPVEHLDAVQRNRYAALVAAREVLRNSRVGAQVFGGSKQEYDAVEAVDLIDVAEFILGVPDPLGEGQPWPTSPAQQTPARGPFGWLLVTPEPEPGEASSPGTPPDTKPDTCPTCHGDGTIPNPDANPDELDRRLQNDTTIQCPTCGGTGADPGF